MALAKCRECGAEVSSAAKTCPKCGISKPVITTSKTVKFIAFVFAIGFISSIFTDNNKQNKVNNAVVETKQPNNNTPPASDVERQARLKKEQEEKEQIKAKAEIERQEKTKNLADQIKNVPESQTQKRRDLFQQLVQLNPENQDYINKLKLYSDKSAKQEAAEQAKAKAESDEADRKEKTQKILVQLKTVPASQIQLNQDLYQQLVNLNPGNDDYVKKLKFYQYQGSLERSKQENSRIAQERNRLENEARRATSGKTGTFEIAQDGFYGCILKEYLEKLIGYGNDIQALQLGLIAGGKFCTIFKEGESVFVVERELFGGLMKVRRHGEPIEYWTVVEAIQ